MPRTPDRHPGESDDEGIVLENMSPGQDPTTTGGIRYVNGSFRLKDAIGVFDPRSISSPGGSNTQVQFNDSGTFSGSSLLTYNKTTDTLTITGDLAVNGGDLTSTSTTFNLLNSAVTTLSVGSGATTINIGNSSGTNIISGTTKFPNGISGSLTKLTDGTSYIIAGNNTTITSASNGAVTISSLGYQWNELTTSPKLNTTASVSIAGGLGSSWSAESVGSDVFFFVSGTLDGATQKKSVFGGDVLISGSVEFITASSLGTGSSGMLIAGSTKTAATAEGRSITVAAGLGTSTINAGALRLNAGASGGSSSTAGGVTINGGGSTTTATAGSVSINAGDTSSVSVSANAGNISVYAGSLTGGSPAGQAGAVEIRTGAAASTGIPGNLTLTSQRGKVILKQSTSSIAPGTDTFFYVTGTLGGTDRSVFAGDMFVSGSFYTPTITAGSVYFAGTGGVLSQNNSNLFWDNTNARLGIGIVTPLARFHVSGSATGTVTTLLVKHGIANGSSLPVFDVQNSAGTSLLFISGSGQVNVSTSLLVGSTNNPSPGVVKCLIADATLGNGFEFRPAASNTLLSYNRSGTGYIPTIYSSLSHQFASNNTYAMTIDSVGSISIGAGAYTGRLFVSGSSTAATPTMVVKEGVASPTAGAGTFDVQNSAGTSLLFVTGSGNVTVGAGNLVIGTAGKGIDFSATADAAGKSSELFDDYEKGTWTPAFSATSNSWTYFSQTGNYTKIGNIVHATFTIWINARTGSVNNALSLGGFPYNFNDSDISPLIYSTGNLGGSAFLNPATSASGTSPIFVVSTGAAAAAGANIAPSGTIYYGSITYRT